MNCALFPLYFTWNLLEDGLDTCIVELRTAVVEVDTVLLLLHVGDLGVAEAGDGGAGDDGVDLLLEDAVEVVKGIDIAAVAP